MGFFASRTYVAHQPDDDEFDRLVWMGPPEAVLPVSLGERVVVFRTDEAALVVGPFDVYPTGVELTFDVRLRQDDDDIDAFPWEPRRRRRGEPGTGPPDDFLRLGIEFADGRTWSNLDVSWPAVPDDPSGPILIGLGGSGGGRCWKGEHWLYPLPPPGPLRFFAEWPAFDIAECSATVDGGAIRAAADRAEVLWPD